MSRVLMALLGAVLVANAGLGLYLLLSSEPSQGEAATVEAFPGEGLALIAQEGDSPAATEQVATGALQQAAPEPDSPPPSAAPATDGACFYWGPYNTEVSAREQLAKLRTAALIAPEGTGRVSGAAVQGDPDFMIYVGPFPTQAAARAARDEIRSRGSDASVVTRDDRLVVSTGVFSQRRFAIAQTDKLRSWGYEPKQSELVRSLRRYFLLADLQGRELQNMRRLIGLGSPRSGASGGGGSAPGAGLAKPSGRAV